MESQLPRVFVALDFPDAAEAIEFVQRLDPAQCGVKVGKELFVGAGPDPVRRMVDAGFAVFLDLKFHDIPNTVARACAAATRLGVAMLNVHASGGRAMLTAARDAVERATASPRPLLIAVTVLTSLDDAGLREAGFAAGARETSVTLATLAQACVLDGVVCSAQEAPALRRATSRGFKLVTPGIRLAESAKDDQTRIATPESAIRAGADHLVIGRPVTQARDPLAALAAINAAIAGALA